MGTQASHMQGALSHEFFTLVFSDAFLFDSDSTKSATKILADSSLSDEEKKIARRIKKSGLYSDQTWDECAELANQLQDLYPWQSNSDGPLIFAGMIWFFLRDQGRDIAWFKQRVRMARAHTSKKTRATIIVETPQGILLTLAPNGLWLLPGGKVEARELPICAAARELFEETQLKAQHIRFLFEHESENYLHHVYLVQHYTGTPSAESDATKLHYIQKIDVQLGQMPSQLTQSNQDILKRVISCQ